MPCLPWGKAKNPVPSRPPFHNCYRKSDKMRQPWLLGPGSQLLQVATAEDSHSPLPGPGPTYKGQEEMPGPTTTVCVDWNERGLRDPDLPMLHRASAAQRARQTLIDSCTLLPRLTGSAPSQRPLWGRS